MADDQYRLATCWSTVGTYYDERLKERLNYCSPQLGNNIWGLGT